MLALEEHIRLASGGAPISTIKQIEGFVEAEGYKVKRRTGNQ